MPLGKSRSPQLPRQAAPKCRTGRCPWPTALIRRCYDHLAPGGYLWIKEMHPDNETACDHPAFRRLAALLISTLTAIGAWPYLLRDAPPMLAAAGFAPPRIAVEEYPLGGATADVTLSWKPKTAVVTSPVRRTTMGSLMA